VPGIPISSATSILTLSYSLESFSVIILDFLLFLFPKIASSLYILYNFLIILPIFRYKFHKKLIFFLKIQGKNKLFLIFY
ncbi:hypothetical protein CBCST_19935, partial [Clostridium botulinum C str. Stockholm]